MTQQRQTPKADHIPTPCRKGIDLINLWIICHMIAQLENQPIIYINPGRQLNYLKTIMALKK